MTSAGLRIGSPNYMAPEQVDDSPVGPAADVFALGSVAAYAALGRSPFGEGGPLPVMYRVLHEPADLSGCPSPLRGIIERCLAKRTSDRPSPAEVIDWCRAVTAGRTGQIAQPWLPPAVARRPGRPARLPSGWRSDSPADRAADCPVDGTADSPVDCPIARPAAQPAARACGCHPGPAGAPGHGPLAGRPHQPGRASAARPYCRPLRYRLPGSPGPGLALPTSRTAWSRTGPPN